MFSRCQEISLIVVPMVAGIMSFAASSTLLVMILRSPMNLKVPVRRIVFGLCTYNSIFVLAFASPSFIGYEITCTVKATASQIATIGVLFYNAILSTYFACVIRFGMSEDSFRHKVEPYLHIFANVLAILSSVAMIVTKSNGTVETLCWIPVNLRFRRLIFLVVPCAVSFLIISVNMSMIIGCLISQRRKNDRWMNKMNKRLSVPRLNRTLSHDEEDLNIFDLRAIRFKASKRKLREEAQRVHKQTSGSSLRLARHSSIAESESQAAKGIRAGRRASFGCTEKRHTVVTDESESQAEKGIRASRRASTGTSQLTLNSSSLSFTNQSTTCLQGERSSIVANRNRHQKEAIIQGLLYIGNFFISFVFGCIASLWNGNEKQFVLLLLARFFFLSQGFFTICVYCRPHIKALQMQHSEYSYLKAFWLTIKKGGDNISSGQTRTRRRSNLIRNKVFLDRLERNHKDRMQSIRQNLRGQGIHANLNIFESSDEENTGYDSNTPLSVGGNVNPLPGNAVKSCEVETGISTEM